MHDLIPGVSVVYGGRTQKEKKHMENVTRLKAIQIFIIQRKWSSFYLRNVRSSSKDWHFYANQKNIYNFTNIYIYI